MSRKYNTNWGSSLVIPPLAHGFIIINNNALYLVWVAGNGGSFGVNITFLHGIDNAVFTCKKENGELTVTLTYDAGITYIGR